MSLRDLVRALVDEANAQRPAGVVNRRQAIVTGVGSGTVSLKLAASDPASFSAAVLNSYAPALNDTVWVDFAGPDPIVVGKVGAPHGHSFATTTDRVLVSDTRSTNEPPSYYYGLRRNVMFEFKDGKAIGLHGSLLGDTGDFVGLMTFTKWNDTSGGKVFQIAFSQVDSAFGTAPVGNNVLMMIRASNGSTAWYPWTVFNQQGTNASGTININNLNQSLTSGFYDAPNGSIGLPTDEWHQIIHLRHVNVENNRYQSQVAFNFFSNRVWYRRNSGGDPSVAGNWTPWVPLYEDTGWIELTGFVNGATAYQTGLGNTWTPRYRKKNGVVYLDGLVNAGTTSPVHVCTLPAGFRPVQGVQMVGMFASGPSVRRMDIGTDGAMIFRELVGTGSTTWHNISTSFPV